MKQKSYAIFLGIVIVITIICLTISEPTSTITGKAIPPKVEAMIPLEPGQIIWVRGYYVEKHNNVWIISSTSLWLDISYNYGISTSGGVASSGWLEYSIPDGNEFWFADQLYRLVRTTSSHAVVEKVSLEDYG